jgi:Domain of unknown function (DUF4331)
MRKTAAVAVAAGLMAAAGGTMSGSSHREAPGIAKTPKVDGTDFYMFRSYEPGRANYVTFLANYIGLEDAYGGPNFFTLDEDALYEIHVDRDGNGVEDITFQFEFKKKQKNLAVPVGDKMIPVPLINIGGIGPDRNDTGNLNVLESYTLNIVRGDRRSGQRRAITDADGGGATFRKPVDRIGDKSLRDNDSTIYDQYADNHIYDVKIPGCSGKGRVFVGQRREGFVVNLGEVFDLINLNPLGPENAEENTLADKNVTTLALEVPIACLLANDPIIGAWTTSSLPKRDKGKNDEDDHGATDNSLRALDGAPRKSAFTQVSRLGHPLVNELVIGLPEKDKFNASEPQDDVQFLRYVTHPSLPVLIQALFGVTPPPVPRNDLVAVFLTGIAGLNRPARVSPAEVLRLNTSIAPTLEADQNRLGVLGGDLAGFPNGRRPGDDVVDAALRVVEGILLAPDPAAFPALTDGAFINSTVAYSPDGTVTGDASFRLFRNSFPYLRLPISSSPNPTHQ